MCDYTLYLIDQYNSYIIDLLDSLAECAFRPVIWHNRKGELIRELEVCVFLTLAAVSSHQNVPLTLQAASKKGICTVQRMRMV